MLLKVATTGDIEDEIPPRPLKTGQLFVDTLKIFGRIRRAWQDEGLNGTMARPTPRDVESTIFYSLHLSIKYITITEIQISL